MDRLLVRMLGGWLRSEGTRRETVGTWHHSTSLASWSLTIQISTDVTMGVKVALEAS